MAIEAVAASSSLLLYPQQGSPDLRISKRLLSPGGHRIAISPISKALISHRSRLSVAVRAADSTSISSSQKTIVPDNDFTLAKVSFGVIGLAVGGTLLSYGFGAYFTVFPGSEWSAIMLTYGFPLTIIGMALKYAELKPVPCITYSDAESLREACATPILKQGGGIPRRSAPTLQMIREEVTEGGKYCLVLVFEAKALQLSDFEKRQAKFQSFFGPGITAEIGNGENSDLYEVRLISETSTETS